MMLRPRAGMALLATLLAILVLELLIAGTFHLALVQIRIARMKVRLATLEAAAMDAAAAAISDWPRLQFDTLDTGAATVMPVPTSAADIAAAIRVEHVRPSLFVLHAAAWSPAGERRALVVLLRSATVADFLADITAAAVALQAAGTGHVTGEAVCDPAARRAALQLADTVGAASLSLTGSPPLRHADVPRTPAVLAGVDLRRLACDTTDETLWHAPAAGHGCDDVYPIRHFTGDVLLQGGAGQGILLADGTVTLAADARFEGLILTAGGLRLFDRAQLRGAARTSGALQLQDASLSFDPCLLERALLTVPGLRGPFRAGEHWWIPLS